MASTENFNDDARRSDGGVRSVLSRQTLLASLKTKHCIDLTVSPPRTRPAGRAPSAPAGRRRSARREEEQVTLDSTVVLEKRVPRARECERKRFVFFPPTTYLIRRRPGCSPSLFSCQDAPKATYQLVFLFLLLCRNTRRPRVTQTRDRRLFPELSNAI